MREFHSMAAFGEHLLKLGATVLIAEHEGLETACQIVEKEAKHELGTYQDAAGDFAGWAELADSTKADRLAHGYTENDPGLRSGEMRESIEHKIIAHEGHVGSDDDHLVWFELGTSRQPPRSVLGIAAVHKGEEAAEAVGAMVHMWLCGEGVHGGRMKIEKD